MKRIVKLIESKEAYLYKGQAVRILHIDDSDILTYRITLAKVIEGQRDDEQSFQVVEKVDRAKLDIFIKELLPIEPEEKSDTEVSLVINSAIAKADKLFTSLSAGLLEDFDKLKDNAAYVPVAKQRSETVKTILNIARTQIDIIKLEKLK